MFPRLGGGLELLDASLDEIADFRCLDGHIDPLGERRCGGRRTLVS